MPEGCLALSSSRLLPLGQTFSYWFFAGVDNPNDPFNNGAYPNSWTPPLNSSWTWGVDKIYGSVSFGRVSETHSYIKYGLYTVSISVDFLF